MSGILLPRHPSRRWRSVLDRWYCWCRERLSIHVRRARSLSILALLLLSHTLPDQSQ